MSYPAKFFEDNISRVSSSTSPLDYNLNQGLLAMVRQLENQNRDLHSKLDSVLYKLNELEHLARR